MNGLFGTVYSTSNLVRPQISLISQNSQRPYPEFSNHHIMTYEYRFNENRIERWPLEAPQQRPQVYYNSADSTPWESAGSSPDSLPQPQIRAQGAPHGASHGPSSVHRTSPVSPKNYSVIHCTPPRRRSALRSAMRSTSGRPQSTKRVQWVSDLKKRPQDISSDRKIVKVQVGNTQIEVREKMSH